MAYLCANCQESVEEIYIDLKTGDYLCSDCYFDDDDDDDDFDD